MMPEAAVGTLCVYWHSPVHLQGPLHPACGRSAVGGQPFTQTVSEFVNLAWVFEKYLVRV